MLCVLKHFSSLFSFCSFLLTSLCVCIHTHTTHFGGSSHHPEISSALLIAFVNILPFQSKPWHELIMVDGGLLKLGHGTYLRSFAAVKQTNIKFLCIRIATWYIIPAATLDSLLNYEGIIQWQNWHLLGKEFNTQVYCIYEFQIHWLLKIHGGKLKLCKSNFNVYGNGIITKITSLLNPF